MREKMGREERKNEDRTEEEEMRMRRMRKRDEESIGEGIDQRRRV